MDQGATITVKIPNGIVGYNDGILDFSNYFEKIFLLDFYIFKTSRLIIYIFSYET